MPSLIALKLRLNPVLYPLVVSPGGSINALEDISRFPPNRPFRLVSPVISYRSDPSGPLRILEELFLLPPLLPKHSLVRIPVVLLGAVKIPLALCLLLQIIRLLIV